MPTITVYLNGFEHARLTRLAQSRLSARRAPITDATLQATINELTTELLGAALREAEKANIAFPKVT